MRLSLITRSIFLTMVLLPGLLAKAQDESDKRTLDKRCATPADFGVTDYAYKVSETDFNIKRSLAKAPINEWAHQADVGNVKTQLVIRENQDVIYSSAVVDINRVRQLSTTSGSCPN